MSFFRRKQTPPESEDDLPQDTQPSASTQQEQSGLITFDELEALVETHKDEIDLEPSDEPWIGLSDPPTPSKNRIPTPEPERFPPVMQPQRIQPAKKPPTAGKKKPVSTAPPKPKRKRRMGNWRHDVVAFIFFIGTIGLIAYFSYIWQNPYSALNPLAPATPYIVVSVTPDAAAIAAYHATQTAAVELPPAEITPEAQNTSVPLATSTPINTHLPFAVGSGVLYIPNANGSGCNWASIAGTVTGMQGEPLNNYAVRVRDAADPEGTDVRVFSGSALNFGEGGFEFPLGGTPQVGTFIVQLYSTAGAPISDEFTVETRNSCEENVAIVNFVQVNPL